MLRRAWFVLSLSLLPALGCESATDNPPAWPDDGVTPATGRYAFAFYAPASGSIPAQQVTATIRIHQPSPPGIEIVWNHDGYSATSNAPLQDGAFRTFTILAEAQLVHRIAIQRPQGREELTCEGGVQEIGKPETLRAATCSLLYIGR